MAFLHPIRLTFAGRFQADVSTVNNDVRHFKNSTFKPSFQELQSSTNANGWWNPTGSGAFRFIDCKVTSVSYADGTTTTDPAAEPLIGATVAGADDHTAGKLVDIDPQWQLASEIWGLGVRVIARGTDVFRGEYRPYAFRDLWFNRRVGSGNDIAASSSFQSVIDGVEYAEASTLPRSRYLNELRKTTTDRQLSIRLTTFGYSGGASSPTYTLGTMIGTIGPQLPNEPDSFILGRRFAAGRRDQNAPPNSGITFFPGLLERVTSTLLLDLSNALQIVDGTGTPNDIGTLTVGILPDEDTAENDGVTGNNFRPLGVIPYRDRGWLQRTGGVWAAKLTTAQMSDAVQHPLALAYARAGSPRIAIRETSDGRLAGAEPMVHRVDAPGTVTVRFWSARYGTSTGERVELAQLGRLPNQGGGGDNPDVDDIPVPDIGVPLEALTVPPTVPTGVPVDLAVTDPGHPRIYLDGQIYLLDYRLTGQPDTDRQSFDYVVLHVRDPYAAPPEPTWADAKAVLQQYGNLYPIMSRGFIDLADEGDVWANREILALAFSAPITDSNHMPVTRDLSEGKRRMLLAYLTGSGGLGAREARPAGPEDHVVGHRPPEPVQAPADPAYEPPVDSKTRFAESFRRGVQARRTSED